MEQIKQWEAEPQRYLNIPQEIIGRMKFKVLYNLGGNPHTAWCRDYNFYGNRVRLFDVCVDTSERISGVLTKRRVTWRPSVQMFYVPVCIYELDQDNKIEGVKSNEK
jgi:hypothetical protein